MNRKRGIILIITAIFLLFLLNYNFLDSSLERFLEETETMNVERVIDGDTFVANNDTHVRMLGINTPEKGEKYYKVAKEFLNDSILSKLVQLEYGANKLDKYGRTLAFVFFNNKNINLEIVRNGFAKVYVLDDIKYESDLRNAWEECINSNKNLCEKSQDKCANCIEIKKLDFDRQLVSFYNKCKFSCDLSNWNIKDEGRKKFTFANFFLEGNSEVKVIVGNGTNTKLTQFWENEEYVWTETGDTLFLRDSEDKLVLWKLLR